MRLVSLNLAYQDTKYYTPDSFAEAVRLLDPDVLVELIME